MTSIAPSCLQERRPRDAGIAGLERNRVARRASLEDGLHDWDIDFNNRGTTTVTLTSSAICTA